MGDQATDDAVKGQITEEAVIACDFVDPGNSGEVMVASQTCQRASKQEYDHGYRYAADPGVLGCSWIETKRPDLIPELGPGQQKVQQERKPQRQQNGEGHVV